MGGPLWAFTYLTDPEYSCIHEPSVSVRTQTQNKGGYQRVMPLCFIRGAVNYHGSMKQVPMGFTLMLYICKFVSEYSGHHQFTLLNHEGVKHKKNIFWVEESDQFADQLILQKET